MSRYRFFNLKFLILSIFFLTFQPTLASDLNDFDIRTYSFDSAGIKDLTFEIHSEDLLNNIKKNDLYKNISSIYLKVFWLAPSLERSEIFGIPEGLNDLKYFYQSALSSIVSFVLSPKLSDRFRSYKLTKEQSAEGYEIKAIDETGTRDLREMIFMFSSNGQLKSSKSISTSGIAETFYTYKSKSWSKNKFVLEKAEIKSKGQDGEHIIKFEFNYKINDGIGFYNDIVQTVKLKKNDKTVFEDSISYKFENIHINKNFAKNMLGTK